MGFVRRALPLSDAERPNFKSFVLPTEEEARRIYGDGCRYPLALEEVAAGAQERIEAWLVQFREELENMTEDRIQDEASSIVAMLSKRDVKQSDEINRFWGVISGTVSDTDALRQRPVFDRIEKVADELRIGAGGADDRDDRSPETGKNTAADIKNKLLVFFRPVRCSGGTGAPRNLHMHLRTVLDGSSEGQRGDS